MAGFVVVEGLDGAGTTTQVARLVAAIEATGGRALATHEPTDGPVGRLIRQTLQHVEGAPAPSTLPWMFAADRAWHLAHRVEPALAEGTWVLSDRYLHSSLAYQSLERPLDEVYELNASFRVPDLTVFVEVPVEVCLERMDRRGGERELFEQRETLTRVAAAYDAVMRRLALRGDPIVRVDGTRSIEAVQDELWALVQGVSGGSL